MGMRGIGGVVLVAALAWGFDGPAAANPGDLPDTLHTEGTPILILDPSMAQPCAQRGGICILPGARSTIAVAATDKAPDGEAVTPAADKPSADKPTEKPTVEKLPGSKIGKSPPPPRFSRAASLASSDGAPTPAEGAPWTIELSGSLKRAAWAGNALFLFFDLEDPDALENRQFTALYQAPLKATAKVAARITLSPDEGFRAGHTYRLRIVQLINGREIVLGEGDLSLL
jgi:hypothetical protein